MVNCIILCTNFSKFLVYNTTQLELVKSLKNKFKSLYEV